MNSSNPPPPHDQTVGLSAPRADRAVLAGSPAAVAAPLQEGPGAQIGPYKLLQLLGEGGFGSVFMAVQEAPVHRKVALKIIKLGMDTRQVVARFEQEEQTLALMDHPNIARVLDAGATDAGRPYFVMELVKGEPVVEYCDKHSLSIPERLELFSQVCAAVQHAHTKGIIHRDIKPSNILVSMQDGRPAPKVIDFGIAKATGGQFSENTIFTAHHELIGTPEYMSPEQAEGSMDIDILTDVYSLGAVLYQLLTGSAPFDAKALRTASYPEIQRIIREIEPPKPSTRINRSADALPAIAAHRRLEPRRLGPVVRGELDWIVMKAMEKERARRYETANALAMDVRRYLASEAVLAAPPSAVYRTRKFVRRNRAAVLAGASVAAVLLIGVVAFAWQAKVARDQRDRAVAAEVETRKRAEELRQVSDFQAKMLSQIDPYDAGAKLLKDIRERVGAALAAAKPLVPEDERSGRMAALENELRQVNATDAAQAMIDRTILRPTVAAIESEFKDQPLLQARLRQTLAARYTDLGLYDAAMPLQETALEARRRLLGDEHPDTLESVAATGELLQLRGRLAAAEPYCRDAMEKRRRVLGEEDPKTLESITEVGLLLLLQGKAAQAEPYLQEAMEKRRRVLGEEHADTLSSISKIGQLLQAQGKLVAAEPYYREALEKRRRVLGDQHPDTLASISNMGNVLRSQERLAEAEPYFREAMEKYRRVQGEEHPNTLIVTSNLGSLLESQGRLDEAEPYLQEVLEKRRRVLGDEHPNTLTAIGLVGSLRVAQGKHAAAVALLAPIEGKARRTFTGTNAYRLASILTGLGAARSGLAKAPADFAAAETSLLEAQGIYATAPSPFPSSMRTCTRAIADLYAAWDKAEPGKGYDTKAAEWTAKVRVPADATPRRDQP